MHEIEDPKDDIDIHKLVFIGSSKDKFNFNTFRMPLDFLSAVYNDEIWLKEAEISLIKKKKNREAKIWL